MKIVALILQTGLLEDVGGRPHAVCPKSGEYQNEPLEFVAAQTRNEAFYYCVEHHPDNPNVQHYLEKGLADITILDARTTSGLLIFFKDIANEGAGLAAKLSFMAQYKKSYDIQNCPTQPAQS